MSRKSTEQYKESFSSDSLRVLFCERDLREHPERRAQQTIDGENSVGRKLYSTEYNKEIQNSERRNSGYALFESQRELGSQRQQLVMANHWADQAQRERIHLCSELEMRRHLHQESEARNCQEIEELKRRCCQEVNSSKTTKSWTNLTHSKIRIHFKIRFEDYKNDKNLLNTQESSKTLTRRAVMAVLPLLIKLVLLRVPESQAAKQERRELHELI